MTQRAFIGTSTVRRTFTDELGTLLNPTSVTCTATADDGTTVTLGSLTNPSTGLYQRTMTVLVPTLVSVTWVADGVTQVDTIDVQGAPFVTVAELIASDSSLASKSTSLLPDAIEDAEAECMSITNIAWTRRYTVETLPVYGGCVRPTWPYIARIGRVTVSAYGTTQTVAATDCWLLPGGALRVPTSVDGALVEVGYEHGLREPNREIRRAVLIRARQIAQTPTAGMPEWSERATLTEFGVITRTLPKANATGNALVDAIYNRNAYAGGGGIA